MASQPHSGPLILNRFSFREEIAQGSTASVWRAKSVDDGSLVAIKIVELDFEDASQQLRAKQVVREVRIHETLKHQSVLTLIGGETRVREGQWPGGLYMALELGAYESGLGFRLPGSIGWAPQWWGAGWSGRHRGRG